MDDLFTNVLILALKQLFARRVYTNIVRISNESNFLGVKSELKTAPHYSEKIINEEKVNQNNTKWLFNPPHSL